MNILGLNLMHDSSASLISNGVIIGAVEEERFNRIRHSTSFPKQSIEWLLKKACLTLKDIDIIANSFDMDLFYKNKSPFELNVINNNDNDIEAIINNNDHKYFTINEELKQNGIYKYIGVPHHLAHAAGGYFCSKFDAANIIILDGRGENYSTSLLYAEHGKFTVIKQWEIENSIGHLYTYLTYLSGLYSHAGQEGKTMGLSAYGSPLPEYYKNALSKIITLYEDSYSINRYELKKLYKYKKRTGYIDKTSCYIALLAQRSCEMIVSHLSKIAFKKTGCNNFVLSGGVSLNCEANRKLYKEKYVKNIYIQPASNDGGTSLGAALYINRKFDTNNKFYDNDVYLGPSYSDIEIIDALKTTSSEYTILQQPSITAAQLISSGYIIGWFQGSSEFGPRALGNRSILSDPRKAIYKDIINSKIKHRESWRPFAPSILFDNVNEWFDDSYDCPHMTCSFKINKDKARLIPAVIHIDNTARVQVVSKNRNIMYYNLIEAFNKITGIPIVLNTSFNDRGQPIVNNPQDALATFYSTGIDALIIGNYLLIKPHVNISIINK